MKEVQDLYAENYKTLQRKIKLGQNTWKIIPCSQTEKLITVKMPVLPNISTDSNRNFCRPLKRQSQRKVKDLEYPNPSLNRTRIYSLISRLTIYSIHKIDKS